MKRLLVTAVAAATLASMAGCSEAPRAPTARVTDAPGQLSTSGSAAARVQASASPSGAPGRPTTERRLTRTVTIRGDITPKSVVASGHGLVFAQNMIYTHTITVYDRQGRLLRTIADSVRPADFGLSQYTGLDRGGPVEAAFSPDGRHAYVSNYSMYGPGFRHPGDDVCSPSSGVDDSLLYRVDTASLRIDQVIPVGAVPKFVAVSPDGRLVLVSNWCSYSLSVIDAVTGRQVRRVPLGRYPRGIVVDPGSRTAYVAVMGDDRISRVDLRTFAVSTLPAIGNGPRHLVRDPTGRWLYATLNGDGRVVKIDLRSGRVVSRVRTGNQPRSMTISADGQALYIVNYASDTISKVRTGDMAVLQTLPVGHHPIGITYDQGSGDVWVACYSGSILVFRDS